MKAKQYLSGSYSYQFAEIEKEIKKFFTEQYNHNLLIENRNFYVDDFKDSFLKWFENANLKIQGLEKFPYFYITNGISEFINEVIPEHGIRPISLDGEYPGYSYKAQICLKSGISLPNNLKVLSVPFYKNASIHDQTYDIISDQNSIIDLAWCCNFKEKLSLDISNAGYAAYSFSKTFGIQYHRIGLCFSKKPIYTFEIYHKNNYVNLVSLMLCRHLMKSFDPDFLFNKYYPTIEKICESQQILPSNSLWFGLDHDSKVPLFDLINKQLREDI
jgi:hypothetical protein